MWDPKIHIWNQDIRFQKIAGLTVCMCAYTFTDPSIFAGFTRKDFAILLISVFLVRNLNLDCFHFMLLPRMRVSHVWMHMHKSRLTNEGRTSYTRRSHGTHMNESRLMYECHVQQSCHSHVWHESFVIHVCDIKRVIHMCDITFTCDAERDASPDASSNAHQWVVMARTYEWVMSHIWVSHVTHICESSWHASMN